MVPTIENLYLKRLELIKVRAENIMAVLVTVPNVVKNYIITLDKEIEKNELDKVANFINDRCEHKAMSAISRHIEEMIDNGGSADVIRTAKVSLEVIRKIIDQNIENEIFFRGLDFFGQEPEFGHPEIVKRILRIISDKKEIARLMREELPQREMKVYIGKENLSVELTDFSLITSGYELKGNAIGRIGVIGPTRMDYDNAITVIDCLSELISTKLDELNG